MEDAHFLYTKAGVADRKYVKLGYSWHFNSTNTHPSRGCYTCEKHIPDIGHPHLLSTPKQSFNNVVLYTLGCWCVWSAAGLTACPSWQFRNTENVIWNWDFLSADTNEHVYNHIHHIYRSVTASFCGIHPRSASHERDSFKGHVAQYMIHLFRFPLA